MSARDKAGRQRRIARILRTREVSSQAELARLLGNGSVTQATLSRDLEELGAYKARTAEGEVVYRLPDEPPGGEAWLARMLAEFALDVASSGNLVVLKTPPGGAGPVARALDAASVSGVLGTVAGDDTILVVCREGTPAKKVAGRLRRLAGGLDDVREA